MRARRVLPTVRDRARLWLACKRHGDALCYPIYWRMRLGAALMEGCIGLGRRLQVDYDGWVGYGEGAPIVPLELGLTTGWRSVVGVTGKRLRQLGSSRITLHNRALLSVTLDLIIRLHEKAG